MKYLALATISGRDLMDAVVSLLVIGLVCWLLLWLITKCAVPEPFNKVATCLIYIVAVISLINVVLSLVGHPIISWR